MQDRKLETGSRDIRHVTYLAIVANAVLFLVKLVIGILGGSVALVADAVHSLSDMSTDLAVLLGVRFGAKEPDPEHPYGHGRIETFSAAFIALVLLFVGAGMIYYAALAVAKGKIVTPHATVLAVAGISIITKEWLYRITKRIAVRSHSPALYANAWHHRSDALSSIVVLVGVLSLRAGFTYGDHLAAVAVGLMIVMVAGHVLADCLREFTEGAVDPQTVEHIKKIVNANTAIRQSHKLRTRTVGREVFLDLHILVEPGLSIAAAHEIAETLENTLHTEIPRPVNITVHVEPDLPELRK